MCRYSYRFSQKDVQYLKIGYMNDRRLWILHHHRLSLYHQYWVKKQAIVAVAFGFGAVTIGSIDERPCGRHQVWFEKCGSRSVVQEVRSNHEVRSNQNETWSNNETWSTMTCGPP
jgi:hypothetical protein